ncbi:MAG TPA: ABC transporter substrate-binding protein [Thermoanaerobaculia bacterium]|nr:ABC transporter substrate-binding protein [Thermoanaerobaculia bacterium]
MKRSSLLLTALTVCLALSCSRSHPGKASEGTTLNRLLSGDPATLDPTTTAEELGLRVEDLIFRPLIGLDRQRHSVPSLALSWAVSSDGLVYDVRLDPKAKWDDGSPVTSADVAYTIDRVRDPKVPSVNWRQGFEDVVAVETPDAETVIVRFRRPDAERLLFFTLPIVSAAAYARPGEADRKPVGTGPYRLESWVPNQALTLQRRADAPANESPFEKIVFRIIPSNAVSFQAGVRGDLDEFYITRDQVASARASSEFQAKNRLLKVPLFVSVMIVWNCRNPYLSDARVRRALAMAWPRAETAKRLYPPDGASLISGPYPPGVPENAPELAPPPYDPVAAGRLLDEAGLRLGPDGFRRRGGKRVSIEFLYTTAFPIYRNLAEILREAYAKVGVELTLRSLDWAAMSQRITSGEYDAAPVGNTPLPPTVDPYPNFHSSQIPPNGQNTGFYRNSEADRAMEAARREMDASRRLELFRQVHRLLAADPPADFLWGADQYWGISRRIEGVEVSPVGLFHFLPGPLGWRPAAAK